MKLCGVAGEKGVPRFKYRSRRESTLGATIRSRQIDPVETSDDV